MTLAEDSERLIIGTITPLHMSTASPSPPTMYREHTHMYNRRFDTDQKLFLDWSSQEIETYIKNIRMLVS